MSHKVFRLLIPYFLLPLFVANIFLDGSFYKSILVLQVLFYTFGLLGLRFNNGIFGHIGTFMVFNVAAVTGLYKYRTKSITGQWKEDQSGEDDLLWWNWKLVLKSETP